LLADRVARVYANLSADGATVAITTARVETARAINRAIQFQRRSHHTPGVRLADGTTAHVGDQVATRRNSSERTDRGVTGRNRQLWTVVAVDRHGWLTVEDSNRGRVSLPRSYVVDHVELGWAVTGYGSQGVTTDHAICVIEPSSSRAGVYVGMTRGRHRNIAIVTDDTGLADPAEALTSILQRPTSGVTAHATRTRLYADHGVPLPEPPKQPEELARRRLAPTRPPSLGLGM
jgi:hypothetical protein